jgi:hypothetical protein
MPLLPFGVVDACSVSCTQLFFYFRYTGGNQDRSILKATVSWLRIHIQSDLLISYPNIQVTLVWLIDTAHEIFVCQYRKSFRFLMRLSDLALIS